MYQVRRSARNSLVSVRTARYHVLQWGVPQPERNPLVMLHGWMDVAASWQFTVDAMKEEHWIIAPDLRGFGRTETPPTDNFYPFEYLADLEFLLEQLLTEEQKIVLVGHSLGGNVAMNYAGIRPRRVSHVINIEGFGMPDGSASHASARFAKWFSELKRLYQGEMALKTYDSLENVAQKLLKSAPHLPQEKALWVARHWARQDPESGKWAILGDPAHKVINPVLYRADETLALYERIAAPTLAVEAANTCLDEWWMGTYTLDEYHRRLESVPDCRIATVEDCGHMVHLDQPEVTAALIEDFIRPEAPR